jgi:hypothetical protein
MLHNMFQGGLRKMPFIMISQGLLHLGDDGAVGSAAAVWGGVANGEGAA